MKIDIDALISGDKRVLSKAITLVESSNLNHQKMALELMSKITAFSGKSKRIGISGTPGVGKSTFLESIGKLILEDSNRKIAILAIDPTSPISGGSIMGDKTRMESLAISENCFIRPSPTSGFLGGVARKTRDSILLCEAAGFDTIFVETVGVGQSEFEVSNMVDFFLVLLLPNAGDELQGIKKGILELAHLLVVNKADGLNETSAKLAKNQYENALNIIKSKELVWNTNCVLSSYLNTDYLNKILGIIDNFFENTEYIKERRMNQKSKWFNELVIDLIKTKVFDEKNSVYFEIQNKINDGELSEIEGAKLLISKLFIKT